MSSIPNAKMKHAHAHEGDHPEQVQAKSHAAPKSEKKDKTRSGPSLGNRAKQLGERVEDLAEDAVDAVKARPKTAAAIGAAVLAGAAAIVGGPAIAKAMKGDGAKKPAKKKEAKADKKA